MQDFSSKKSGWFNQLLHNSHIGILVVDENRTNLMVNECLCHMFGYESSDLIGKSAKIFHISKQSYEKFASKAFNLVLDGKPISIEWEFKRKNGTRFWSRISGDIVKGQKEVLWTFVDITKRIEITNELENNQKHLFAINQLINLGHWELNLATKIAKISKEMCSILGVEHRETITLDEYLEIVHPDDRHIMHNNLKTLLSGKKSDGSYVRLQIQSNGKKSIRHVYHKSEISFDSNGEPKYLVGATLDVSELKELEKRIQIKKDIYKYQAEHDFLTGLPNRMLLTDRLNQSIKKAKRDKKRLAILFIDLDGFKYINDRYGHDQGDRYLKELSSNMKNFVRASDTIARLGGDEFIVLLENVKDKISTKKAIEKFLKISKNPIKIEDEDIYPKMSIGVALYPDDADNSNTLIKYADEAMYRAKISKEHSYCFITS